MATPRGWERVVRRIIVYAGIAISGAVFVAVHAPTGAAAVASAREPQPLLDIPECPHEWTIPDRDAPGGRAPIEINLSRDNTNVPEYHDCQRLVQQDRKYGPLVAVFASDRLETLVDRVTQLQHSPRLEQAVAAAEIWNVDTTDYVPLKIKPGFSCVYLYSYPRWRAKLVYYGWPQPNCRRPIDPTAVNGLDLTVRLLPTRSTDFTAADIPATARWEWDSQNKTYYIGFRCETRRWCEVGLASFQSSQTHSTNLNWPRDSRSFREIKGWYDEQQLASVPIGAAAAVPGMIVGTVFPARGLKTHTIETYTRHWIEVAYVALDIDSPAYRSKFNFVKPQTGPTAPAPATPGSSVKLQSPKGRDSTTVYICRGNAADCVGIPAAKTCSTHEDTLAWWARIDAPGRQSLYKCVWYRSNPNGELSPGTVRWRWVASDETIWVGCPHGCCEVGQT